MDGFGRYFNSYDGSVAEGRLWKMSKIEEKTEALDSISQVEIKEDSQILREKLQRRGCGVGVYKTIGETPCVFEGEIDCGIPHGKGTQ